MKWTLHHTRLALTESTIENIVQRFLYDYLQNIYNEIQGESRQKLDSAPDEVKTAYKQAIHQYMDILASLQRNPSKVKKLTNECKRLLNRIQRITPDEVYLSHTFFHTEKEARMQMMKALTLHVMHLQQNHALHVIRGLWPVPDKYGEAIAKSFLDKVKKFVAYPKNDTLYYPYRDLEVLEEQVRQLQQKEQMRTQNHITVITENTHVEPRLSSALKKQLQTLEYNTNSTLDTPSGIRSFSIEEKISRIEARVDTIIQNTTITQTHKDELETMLERLSEFWESSESELLEHIHSVQQRIHALLDNAEHNTLAPQKNTDQSDSVQDTELHEWHDEPESMWDNWVYIQTLHELRHAITYKDSSLKGGESIGDGTFIADVWRPFLTQVQYLLQHDLIDAESFSWQEVIEKIHTVHQENRAYFKRKAFMDLLIAKDTVMTWEENLYILIEAVEGYANMSVFFGVKERNVRPLGNILPKLKQYIQENVSTQ